MRETMTFALAVLLAVPLLGGDAAVDELVVQAKDHVHDYSLTPADSIGGVIEKALGDATTAPELYAVVRDRFGLKDNAARLITIAALNNLIAEGGTSAGSDEAQEEVMRMLDRDYGLALRSDPSNAAVAREYLVLLANDENQFADAGKRVHDVLRGLPRDRRRIAALQVMSDGRVRHVDAALFDEVTDAYGFDPLALAAIGDELTSSSCAEIFDRAAALWLERKDVDSAAAAASRAMYAYANRRSLADVLRIYRSLPAEGKVIVSRAAGSEATVRSRGVERRLGMRDIRFTLAAAFILAGDDRAALPLIAATQLKNEDESIAAMLMAAIDSPGGDAFELVTDYLQSTNPQRTALVDEVFDGVATRAGYATASKWRLDTVARDDERLAGIERMMLPAAVAALLPVRVVPDGAATASPVVARLLNPALLAPFVESAIDDNARAADERTASRIVRPLPAGFDFLRMEAHGDDVVAVASSQNIDPTRGASAGGYWILRSADRGATWNPPLYTGLRVLQPYEVVIGSTLPMLRDDGVRIEVATMELDGRIKELVAVDLKWTDLERDSDHDGLTDLMEERLLTDPNAADTDGDGLLDGVDPLPQVALRDSDGETAPILAAAIEQYYGSGVAHISGKFERDVPTMFIAGDPADFAAMKSRMRIIVISDAEVDAASKKFGPTTATRVSPVIIDHTGTRAWVQLCDGDRGTTYVLAKRDGAWTALQVAAWVY